VVDSSLRDAALTTQRPPAILFEIAIYRPAVAASGGLALAHCD